MKQKQKYTKYILKHLKQFMEEFGDLDIKYEQERDPNASDLKATCRSMANFVLARVNRKQIHKRFNAKIRK